MPGSVEGRSSARIAAKGSRRGSRDSSATPREDQAEREDVWQTMLGGETGAAEAMTEAGGTIIAFLDSLIEAGGRQQIDAGVDGGADGDEDAGREEGGTSNLTTAALRVSNARLGAEVTRLTAENTALQCEGRLVKESMEVRMAELLKENHLLKEDLWTLRQQALQQQAALRGKGGKSRKTGGGKTGGGATAAVVEKTARKSKPGRRGLGVRGGNQGDNGGGDGVRGGGQCVAGI